MYKDILLKVVRVFGKRKCVRCGEKLKEDWSFCPHCGEVVEEENLWKPSFSNSKPKKFRKGPVSIIIRGESGFYPIVEVKGSVSRMKNQGWRKTYMSEEKAIERKPKIIEEPQTEVKTVENKKLLSIKLPGVKSEKDVDVKRLEQSLEVRASVGKKTYFTLVPISRGYSIVNKELKNEVLMLELEK